MLQITSPTISTDKIDLLFTVHVDKEKGRTYELISSSKHTTLDQEVSKRAGNALQKVITAISGPSQFIKNPEVLTEGEIIQGELTPNHEMILTIPGHNPIKVILNQTFATAFSGNSPAPKKVTPPPSEASTLPNNPQKNSSTIVPIKNKTSADCFMNATFQVIMHDELLRKALQETYQTQNTTQAQALCRAMKDYSEGKIISTTDLRLFMPAKLQKGQQDASEFLQQLLNGVSHKDHPELFSSQTVTYAWEKKSWLFGSVTETKTTFGSTDEFFIPLQIPTQAKTISGAELIQDHFAKKKHSGEGLKDDKTGTVFSPAQVQTQIDGTPKRLVFLLKRFTQYSKIGTQVNMPDLVQVSGHAYALKKMIVHHGTTMGSGHYTSVLQTDEGSWTKADDTRISAVKEISQERQNGYIYFYELIKG